MEVAHEFKLPLHKLVNEMSYDELLMWMEYFRRTPMGWKDDRRASLVMSSLSGSDDTYKAFPTLIVMREESRIKADTSAQSENLVKSGFLEMLVAKGRSKGSDWNPEVEIDDASDN